MPGTEVRIVDKDESGIGEVIQGSIGDDGYYKDAENTAKTIKDGWLMVTMDIWMKTDSFI